MATTTTADATLDNADVAEPKVRRRRGPLIVIAVVALALAGGAGWWFSRDKQAAADSKPAPEKEAPPVYLQLDQFTVNLQPENGDQYLQVALSVRVADDATVESLKARMPEVRSHILLLLSSKRASELISAEGKDQLRADIRQTLAAILDPAVAPNETATKAAPAGSTASATVASAAAAAAPAAPAKGSPIIEVLFTSFIVQ